MDIPTALSTGEDETVEQEQEPASTSRPAQEKGWWASRGLSIGPVAWLIALAGTLLLKDEPGRTIGGLLIVAGSVLGVVAWGRNGLPMPPPFASLEGLRSAAKPDRSRLRSLGGIALSLLLMVATDLWFLTHDNETFGLAGWFWLLSMAVLLVSMALWPHQQRSNVQTFKRSNVQNWPLWEIATLVGLTALSFFLRLWDLSGFPSNIYPDEIMTGTVASNAYFGGPTSTYPPIFTTLWGDIDLPALWFLFVAGLLKIGGGTLAAVRLPAALFGAAAALPMYGLARSNWGRPAAIASTAIFAFSAANVHYSRQGLNNIVTVFFWALCFFFLLRGLRSRRPFDWACAGLAAGLSEYGFYATRLLPFLLAAFFIYLLVIHWRSTKHYLWHFGLFALSYVVAFGPLLIHFILNPRLYFGHGSSLLLWNQPPNYGEEAPNMLSVLWTSISENLLGFSTHPSQEIVWFAPLLLPAEAALLALGAALLVWKWKHPAAFLMLLSGLATLIVGGVLTRYAPSINRWMPAFPAFYIAIGLPIAAWIGSAQRTMDDAQSHRPSSVVRRLILVTTTIGLIALALLNIDFYFRQYYADPELLTQEAYRRAQSNYEMQTMQSRYQASLGPNYMVRTVGASGPAYDHGITGYLVKNQDWAKIAEPEKELPLTSPPQGKGLAFIFYPGNEQYIDLVRSLYPGGADGTVSNPKGKLVFYTYLVPP